MGRGRAGQRGARAPRGLHFAASAWLLLAALPGSVDAAERALGDATCEQLEAAASADSALLMSPTLFGSVGAFNVVEGSDLNGPVRSLTPRIAAGLSYSFGNLFEGIFERRRAQALCARFRAEQGLLAALEAGNGAGARSALAARAAVLAKAIPEGERLLNALQRDVSEARATLEELSLAKMRLDSLREEEGKARLELAQQEQLPSQTRGELTQMLADYRAADASVASREGSIRLTRSWDVQVRGGYENIIGITQQQPFFGQVTLSYNLGNLFQYSANARAREARTAALEEDLGGAGHRFTAAIARLGSTMSAERERLSQVETLLAELDGQLGQVGTLQTSLVRRYQSYLWFEATRLRAERAWLAAHLEELELFLSKPAEGPTR